MDVRLAVDGGEDVGDRLDPEALERGRPLACDRREAPRDVGHHVPDDLHPARNALCGERPRRARIRAEQQRRDAVDDDSVPLLGHVDVAAAQARLDVRDGDAGLDACFGTRARRVRVAEDDHPVRPLRLDRLADQRPHRVRVRGVQVEEVPRLAEAQLVEEDLRHLGVPVLARVQDDLLDSRVPQRQGKRSRLDELRAVADDREDLHPAETRSRRVEASGARLRPRRARRRRSRGRARPGSSRRGSAGGET